MNEWKRRMNECIKKLKEKEIKKKKKRKTESKGSSEKELKRTERNKQACIKVKHRKQNK